MSPGSLRVEVSLSPAVRRRIDAAARYARLLDREAARRRIYAFALGVIFAALASTAIGEPLLADGEALDPGRQPLVELHGGFYQVFEARGGGRFDSRRAWLAQLTVRTPAWKRWRLFGALETAPQSGASDLDTLTPWDGGEGTLGLSFDGPSLGPWSISPAIAAGGTIALGADQERIDVRPLQALAGVRLAAGDRDSDWRFRAYVGYGIREQLEALPAEGCEACAPATEADRRWAIVADVLVRVPGLPAGAAVRVKFVHTREREEIVEGIVGVRPGAKQWLVGLVAGVP